MEPLDQVYTQSPIWISRSYVCELSRENLEIFFLSIANLQILYILNILWLTKSGETNAWSCYCQRKCPSTNFVLTTYFLNYLNYLCRIKWIESVQKIPLTCLDMCRMLSINFTGDVIVCLNGDCHVYSVCLLYVAWCDRHFQGFCKLQSTIIFTWYYSPCSVMLRHLLFGSKKDEVVVCKNACINPLKHFPAVSLCLLLSWNWIFYCLPGFIEH